MFVCLGYGWVGCFFFSFYFFKLVCYAHVFPCTYMYIHISLSIVCMFEYTHVHIIHIVVSKEGPVIYIYIYLLEVTRCMSVISKLVT